MSSSKNGNNHYTAAQFIAAIPKSGGIVSTIASRIGCTWHTARKYIDTMPTIEAAYTAECERVLDMAEGVLMKSIEKGDTADAKWYLTRKGKRRGYAERKEIEHGTRDGDPLNVRFTWQDDSNGASNND